MCGVLRASKVVRTAVRADEIVQTECNKGLWLNRVRFVLLLLSCALTTLSNKFGPEVAKCAVQCYFYVIFSFSQPQMLHNKPYIAIYWIFLRIFARIFRGRRILRYLAVNDADDVRKGGVGQVSRKMRGRRGSREEAK